MNLELVEKMTELLTARRARRTELAEEYKTAKGERARQIYDEVDQIVKGNNEIKASIKAVKTAYNKYMNAETAEEKNAACDELVDKQEVLYTLAEKYGVEIEMELPEEDLEEEPVEEVEENVTEEKKNHTLKNIAMGAVLFGLGAGVTACTMSNADKLGLQEESETQATTDEEETIETEVEETFKETEATEPTEPEIKIEDVDTEIYGMTSAFTDASDEEQVMQRATDIYNLYVNTENMPEAIKEQLSIDRIANFIRMANGEFALEDGSIEYNASIHDEMANLMATYCNSTSLQQLGTNLEFKPTCIFFENDSLAHHSAAQADELVKAVYEDIKANDVEKFTQDSVAWGEFVRDTFIYTDMSGERISIWSVDAEQQYPLTSAIISVYGPSILEYSMGVDLARSSQENMFGDSYGICIPFCYNAENELEYMPLSEMIYHINFTPMNTLAKRAGYAEEWAEEYGMPMTVRAYNNTREYFDSKYELEAGQTLKLK